MGLGLWAIFILTSGIDVSPHNQFQKHLKTIRIPLKRFFFDDDVPDFLYNG
jgi:hypothetical protein